MDVNEYYRAEALGVPNRIKPSRVTQTARWQYGICKWQGHSVFAIRGRYPSGLDRDSGTAATGSAGEQRAT